MSADDQKIWDHIIVGAGSSGCVVAERLSANSTLQILLIESGGENRNPFVTMPRGFGQLNGRKQFNWLYRAEPTGHSKRREYWLRGRGLGGSGAVNGSVYVRGLPADFDEWEASGCLGWGWSHMKSHFEAVEGGEGVRPALGVSPHAGGDGLCDAAIDAAVGLGTPRTENLNAIEGAAIGYQPRSILKGRRRSAANTFLATARKRTNFSLASHSDVQRLLFEGRKTVGVEVRTRGGGTKIFKARNITLCAGALNTPKILMLSGIGPEEKLRDLGLPIVAHAPQVGQNLREHRLLSLQFRLSGGSQNHAFRGLGLALSVAQYYALRSGPLAQSAFEVGGFIQTQPNSNGPDAQIGFAPISMDKTTQKMKVENFDGALCGGYAMRPQSAGSLALTSSDPEAALHILPNYLNAVEDQQISIAIVRYIRQLFARPEMNSFAPVETFPSAEVETDDEILDAFHQAGQAGFHAAGTCRMGADAQSVVDTNTRVRGVDGLTIGDISIMPALVSGNTNAPAMAMAHRAAELIIQ